MSFAALRKLSTRPVSSLSFIAKGMVAVRFVSIFGAQNMSVTWTLVKSTGRIG